MASAECQNRAGHFGLKVLKACSGQVPLHLGKFEHMKAVISATPLAHTAKLQDTSMTCDESENCKNCRRLHDASHLSQSNRGIGKEMKRATTEDGIEKTVFEWKCLHSCTGEMHVGNAFLYGVSGALSKHPHGHVYPEHLLRRRSDPPAKGAGAAGDIQHPAFGPLDFLRHGTDQLCK